MKNWWLLFPEDIRYTLHIDTAFKGDQMDPNKPEPAPMGTGREITPLVIKDLELRSAMGAKKYGETLRAFNGRDALVDAYQEALDLVQYLRQAIEEKQNPPRMTAREFLGRQEAARTREALEQRMIETGQTTRDALDQQKKEVLEKLQAFTNPDYTARAFYDRELARAMGMPVMFDALAQNKVLFPEAFKDVESIAQEAHRLVLGARGEAYGHPIFDMTRSADMLTALLRDKLRSGVRLEAEDIGQAMVCVKQSRQRNKAKRDNLTDTAGYALTLQMIAEWREQNPGVDPRNVFPGA